MPRRCTACTADSTARWMRSAHSVPAAAAETAQARVALPVRPPPKGTRTQMSLFRRAAALLIAGAMAAAAAAPAAVAAPPSAKTPNALYGRGDPTFDGVYRQSYALLALAAADTQPAPQAVKWLLDQQCPNGGFTSYRPAGEKGCDPAKEDTNSTGLAIMALHATGSHSTEVDHAYRWLEKQERSGGGFPDRPADDVDANSTAIAMDAANSLDHTLDQTALLRLQLTCKAPGAQRGAFAYQPRKNGDLKPNDNATAAAAQALLAPQGLPVGRGHVDTAPRVACGGHGTFDPGQAVAAYLEHRLASNGNHLNGLNSSDGPDLAATAEAAVALSAAGQYRPARAAVAWLQKNSATWAKGQPAALAELILASVATGTSPAHFAGHDLVGELADLGPDPASLHHHNHDSNNALTIWLIVACGLALGAGAGYAFTRRRSRT